MREKELRLALVCYGGISLAVYMHGITKEVWRLARASRAHQKNSIPAAGSEAVYRRLLAAIAETAQVDVHVIVDILAGASAGGINAIFLAQAISSGQSLDPLTRLWLDTADVERLIDPDSSALSRFAKSAAVPFAWMLSRRGDTIDQTVEEAHQDEVRAKLASFVRGRWFAPPFGGPQFTNLLLDAFDAMADGPVEAPLLPDYQPLDLFVTVTDFRGHPERLRLHSPAEVMETEHRLVIEFRDRGGEARSLADPAELAFAARATASFPGAFPPFQPSEMDAVLAARQRDWPGREPFLQRVLPHHHALGEVDSAILIDGSVLANAPFRPAMAALQSRPASREVDRRFVYIDPTPDAHGASSPDGVNDPPGFFATIFGALSNIPREQPIRDNLDAIDGRSERIRRLRRIVDAMRPRVEAAIEETMGSVFLLGRPTGPRLAAWRQRAQRAAAREAGYSYAAYGHLKIAAVTEEAAALLHRLGGGGGSDRLARIRALVWHHLEDAGLTDPACMTGEGARDDAIDFLRTFDLSFRTRRLRFLARRLGALDSEGAPHDLIQAARRVVYECIGAYRHAVEAADVAVPDAIRRADVEAAPALAALGTLLDLKRLDDQADARLAEALIALPKAERRAIILTYLGFPYYDVATLPMLQGEGLDEFDPVKIDRIAPDDAVSIRAGGAAATLKGTQFNNFGAFFSRAYRENDYLWGRLHGAERLIDITVSTLPEGASLDPATVAAFKRDIFRAILDEERGRLGTMAQLFDELDREIG